MNINTVISPYRAIVDGESTPLAGCNNAKCIADCLRKDPQLVTLHDHNCPKSRRFFVSRVNASKQGDFGSQSV